MNRGGRRRLIVAVIGAGLVTLGLGPQPQPLEIEFVDMSRYPTIEIVFHAPEGLIGVEVDDLSVRVLESAVQRPSRVTPFGGEPVAAVLAIDVSGSMEGAPLEAARQAAIGFVQRMPEGSEIAVVAFGTGVQVVRDFGPADLALVSAINGLELAGNTALYDAVIVSSEMLESRGARRPFMVLLSDGGDTTSAATQDAAVSALASAFPTFYAVELDGSGLDPAAIATMAAAVNGTVIRAEDTAALGDAYDDIATAVIAQFAVEYQTASGGPTVVEVEVTAPDGTVYRNAVTLDLPSLPGPAPGATTTTSAANATTLALPVAPPPAVAAPPPGRLSQPWTLMAGAIAMFGAFVILTAYAIRPAEAAIQRRRSVLDDTVSHRLGLLGRLTAGVTGTAERVFASRERAGGLARSLEAAGVALRAGEFAVVVALAVFVALFVGLAMGDLFVGLLLAVAAILIPRFILSQRATSRRRKFGEQLDGTLQLLAGSLRAGFGLTQALDAVSSEAPSPTGEEFSRVVVETRLGRDLLDSAEAMARRMDNPDMLWVAEAIGIQRQVGGDLSEVLDTVATTVRERATIKRQVRSLSAEGRMSAIVLIALPFVIVALLSAINPTYLTEMYASPVGRVLAGVAVLLMIAGVIWIRRLINIKF